MHWLVKLLGRRALKWWLRNRPLSKESRAARKERRRRKRLGLPPIEETQMDKLRKVLDLFLTAHNGTKTGVIGWVPLVAALPFYETINDFIVRACQAEEGPTLFLVGGFVVWLVMFLQARFGGGKPAQ